MPLYSNPPHRCTILGPPTQARDDGGGTVTTWPTTRQAAVPCVINTVSGSEAERFAQQGLTVTHTIAILSSALTAAVARGDKVTADDTGESFHVRDLRRGRSMGSIPGFTYLGVEQQL